MFIAKTRLTTWARLNWIEVSELGCLSVWKMKCWSPGWKRDSLSDLLAGNSIVIIFRALVLPGASLKHPSAAYHTPKKLKLWVCLCDCVSQYPSLGVFFFYSVFSLCPFSVFLSFRLLFLNIWWWCITLYLGHVTWCCGKTRAEPTG